MGKAKLVLKRIRKYLRLIVADIVFNWEDKISICKNEYFKKHIHNCGTDVFFYKNVSICFPDKVSIGNHTHIGERVHLRGGGRIKIGDWCQIANNTIVVTSGHPIDGGRYYGRTIESDVTIGNNVWIGSAAIILPGVRIGDNSVVAAGAVVVKDVESNTVVAGIPAKKIRTIKEMAD